MADSLFDVLDHHTTRKTAKNVLRQPMSYENLGKSALKGPVKPLEPLKKALKPGEVKKSFLSNAGKAFQSTPARQVFSPKIIKVNPMIYTEEKDEGIELEDIEFTKPSQRFGTHWGRVASPFKRVQHNSPAVTPPPKIYSYRTMTELSDHDDFSDFSIDSLPDEDLGLPDPY